MIGIIGAMQIETNGLADQLNNKQLIEFESFKFYLGQIEDREVVICCCGIGKVNSSAASAVMLCKFPQVSLVINLGVAGGLKKNIKQGDIAISSACVQHDYDQTPDGLKKGQIAGLAFVNFESDKESVEKMQKVLKASNNVFYTGVIASGDQFINDKQKAQEISNEFSAIACDMESAAIAQVCHIFNRKFFSMRAISDNGDDGAITDFYSFVTKAALVSINAVIDFLKN